MVTPGRLLVRLHWVPGDPWVIARDGHEWDALAVVMTRLRADPGLDAFGEVLVYPKAGVPYRDLIRAYEVADHAGFDAPRLLPPWASHLAPPGRARPTSSRCCPLRPRSMALRRWTRRRGAGSASSSCW